MNITSNKGLMTLTVLTLVMGLAAAVFLVRQPQLINKQAAVSPGPGKTTIKLTPLNPTLFVSQPQTITANINTGTTSIRGYQIIMTFTYAGTIPVTIPSAQVTNLEPALSNCLTNNISHDVAAKKYTFGVSCLSPIGGATYSTNNADKPIFSFSLTASAPGSVDFVFDNINSKVTSAADITDILAFPTGTKITVVQDTQPPTTISNLTSSNIALNSFNVNWAAPSDIGVSAQVASYEIRSSTSAITDANWNQATVLPNPPVPAASGTLQTYTLTGLNPNTTYYVAIKSRDALGNISALSNVLSAQTLNNPSLTFRVGLEAINSQKPNQNLQIILKQGTNTTHTFNSVSATADAQGIYSSTIPNIAPGTYDVYIKGQVYLRKKISGIVIATGSNTQNWPGTPPVLKTGDINNDNTVDLSDYSILAGHYSPGVTKNVPADLNIDSMVDITDYSFLAGNYAPGTMGD